MMSIIEANITIDIENEEDINLIVSELSNLLTAANNKQSEVFLNNVDNPITNNPINYRPGV